MKVIVGVGYEFTEDDFKEMERSERDGKVYFLLKHKATNKTSKALVNQEILENLLKQRLGKADICKNLNCTSHILNKSLTKYYGTDSVKEIRKKIA